MRPHGLFDVDETLIDSVDNQRRVWAAWSTHFGLDADEVYEVALRTRPVEMFVEVLADSVGGERGVAHPRCAPAVPTLEAAGPHIRDFVG